MHVVYTCIPVCEGWTDEDTESSDAGVGSSNSSTKYENSQSQ